MTAMNPHTAEAILQRLLVVLPEAARKEGGAPIDPLADQLGVEPRRVLRDLKELEARSYYLPAGLGDQIQLTLTRKRLGVWTTGEFRRPVRLTPREALALELGLRVVARSAPDEDRSTFDELRERVVLALRSPAAEEVEDPAVALGGAEATDDPLHARIEAAVRERKELRIVYRPPGRDPSPRRVGPLFMAHAEGRWYLLARDREGGGLRAFRVDRVLAVEETGARFRPEEGDAEEVERFFRDGRVYDRGGANAPESFDAVVRYSPRIARWIREREWEEVGETEDGGLSVRHRIVDPEWLLRHVLSYGGEASIVEPQWMREQMVKVVEAFG